jgi:hypothetical protein
MVVGSQQFLDGTYQPVGTLVPDVRLQAIADAWNAFQGSITTDLDDMQHSIPYQAFGELRALLDALTQDNGDE